MDKKPLGLPDIFVIVLTAAFFSLAFYYLLGRISPSLYFARDDGIITMSHARNFVDFGFIGVNPSGERIEGFSAPIQFWVYALMYAITRIDPFNYTIAQTLVSTFLMGGIMFIIIRRKLLDMTAATLSIIAAIILGTNYTFSAWHGSGMENAITHVLMLSLILIGLLSYQQPKLYLAFAAIAILSSLSRLEGVYYVLPIILAWTVFVALKERSAKVFWVFLAFIAGWGSYQLFRYVYFGDLTPNTARVQNIDVLNNLRITFLEPKWDYISWRIKYSVQIFMSQGGYFILGALILMWLGQAEKYSRLFLVWMLLVLATALASPLVFGSVRIDQFRLTTFLFPLAIVFFLFVLRRINFSRRNVIIASAVFVSVVSSTAYASRKPFYLCCDTDNFSRFAEEWSSLKEAEEIIMPTVANADLGIISWHKKFNIIDLGRLGSPILTRITHKNQRSEFFFEVAKPDIIELHSIWYCGYDFILQDARFEDAYTPIHTKVSETECIASSGLWIRKDIMKSSLSRERAFHDELRMHPVEEYARLVNAELQHCQKIDILSSCDYVSRTLYRFMPELRAETTLIQ